VDAVGIADGTFQITIQGPPGTTVLGRGIGLDIVAPVWADGYRRLPASNLVVHAPLRPFVGLSPSASPQLRDFMQRQGYIVEISEQAHRYAYYFDRDGGAVREFRSLMAAIEATDLPLVRLGRWPNGARSALAITGDIDALTLWDFGLRILGR
jgi:hypothetical protein